MLDDEDSEITAGATVTVTVRLKRTNINVSEDETVSADKRVEDELLDDTPEAIEDAHSTVSLTSTQ